ncbi:MAG: sugar phosphorylase [Treponema sp.]|nr:sugar phosphorylase [Treponema sp.]
MNETIRELLIFLYGKETAEGLYPRFMEAAENFARDNAGLLPAGKGRYGAFGAGGPEDGNRGAGNIGGGDAFLISYGDMLGAGEKDREGTGLARLNRFLSRWNRGRFTFLHLLPFHPYSSDDGFSVIDYRQVDERFGAWEDIRALAENYKMAFDFVINHGSVKSRWFQSFLAGKEPYGDWFISRPAGYDSSAVVRPRTHPLLSPFRRGDGSTVYVWTTFSADQADYDFSRPGVLLEFTGILLDYYRRGGKILRLDAIAYLWKEDGTPCLHHPKTHAVVKLFRAVIDLLGLDMLLLTETNVPHRENVSYFGRRGKGGAGDEAHLVYNFALPPLVLHGAVSGDAGPLRRWAKDVFRAGWMFLNFLASHDGVGLTPARGLIDDEAFARTIAEAGRRGALISYKSSPAGDVPYELNCSWADMVAPRSLGTAELRARAFLATQAVLFALPGLPAVYFHSWIGSEGWKEGPGLLGYNRAINRQRPSVDLVESELNDKGSFRYHVYHGFGGLMDFRKTEAAFDPESPCRVLDSEGSIFALERGPDRNGRRVLCIQNLGRSEGLVKTDIPSLNEIPIESYQIRWIVVEEGRPAGEYRN